MACRRCHMPHPELYFAVQPEKRLDRAPVDSLWLFPLRQPTTCAEFAVVRRICAGAMKFWAALLFILLSVSGLHAEQPPFAPGENAPISEREAIVIATRYLKENEPKLDISSRAPRTNFSESTGGELFPKGGVWMVSFGIPSPPGYSRPIISRHVFVDRFGRIVGIPLTTSP